MTARLKAAVDGWRQIPTTIPITTPLPSLPPKKKVVFFQCEDPATCNQESQIKPPLAALGWEVVTVNAKLADPTAGWDAALQANPDFIALPTASPFAAIETQLAETKKRGIHVISMFGGEVGTGLNRNGVTIQIDGQDSDPRRVTQVIDWIALDNPDAHIAYVTFPDFPILVTRSKLLRTVASTDCPGCKITDLEVPLSEYGTGAIPGRVVSFLQQNPDTTHLYFSFNGPFTGVPEALKLAGLDKSVKLVGEAINQAILNGIVDGTVAMFVARDSTYTEWQTVDAMARIALGLDLTKMAEQYAVEPTVIVDSPELAKQLLQSHDPFYYAGPTGLEDQFKKLWGVD